MSRKASDPYWSSQFTRQGDSHYDKIISRVFLFGFFEMPFPFLLNAFACVLEAVK